MASTTIPDPCDDGTGYAFCARDMRRAIDVIRRVEAQYRNTPAQRARGPVAGGESRVRVWMPSGIAAGTLGSPGEATDAIRCARSGNGWTTSGGTVIGHLYNCDTTAIVGAKAGWAVKRGDGTYELMIGDC